MWLFAQGSSMSRVPVATLAPFIGGDRLDSPSSRSPRVVPPQRACLNGAF